MKSTGQKILQIEGLLGTSDLTKWEAEFVGSIVDKTLSGRDTSALTEKQTAIIERIWRKHFS